MRNLARNALVVGAAALFAGCGGLPQSGRASADNSAAHFTGLGTLFGTTSEGGTHGGGTVFELDQYGHERILHNFGRKGDGIRPLDRVTYVNGKLYGTTLNGGAYGLGTVFSVTLSGAETVLHSFGSGSTDGASPSGRLLDVNGILYGTTLYGGEHNFGTVFSITQSGTERIVHSFGFAPDGVRPYAGLIEFRGTLYGTTLGGGTEFNLGTVFAISKSGDEEVIHSFIGGGNDGETPYAPLHDVNGTLYGTTYFGGTYGLGTVYTISTSGEVTVVHSFGGPGDGANPYAPVSNIDRTIFGTTYYGGANNYGTVFTISKTGTETVLHSFSGSNPIAAVHEIGKTLYGTTWEGGNSNLGTVFTISRSGNETQVYSFGGGPDDGANPYASLIDVTSGSERRSASL